MTIGDNSLLTWKLLDVYECLLSDISSRESFIPGDKLPVSYGDRIPGDHLYILRTHVCIYVYMYVCVYVYACMTFNPGICLR